MRNWLRGALGVAGVIIAMPLVAMSAGAAAPTVNTYFVSAASSIYVSDQGVTGWDTTGETIGPSPPLASISVDFLCNSNSSLCVMDVVLSSSSGTLEARMSGGIPDTATGTTTESGAVISATGAYGSVEGAPASISIIVSSMNTVGELLGPFVGVGYVVGSFTVS